MRGRSQHASKPGDMQIVGQLSSICRLGTHDFRIVLPGIHALCCFLGCGYLQGMLRRHFIFILSFRRMSLER
jgi:hypothetical protein